MHSPELSTLFFLLGAHALSDYVWQPDYMARLKRPNEGTPTERARYGPWQWWMIAHGLINGILVSIVTGSAWLGWLETIFHSLVDIAKCKDRISRNTDQVLHLASKLVWASLT